MFEKIVGIGPEQIDLQNLLIMSQHPSGYKREHAVRRLGFINGQEAIAALIERANDWVPQVRVAAQQSLRNLLVDQNVPFFINLLSSLHHLRHCARAKHEDLIADVIQLLLKPNNLSHIIAALDSQDPTVVRLAVKLCIDNDLVERAKLVTKCLDHDDVIVRCSVVPLLRELNENCRTDILTKALHDPFMPIRREALVFYLRSIGTDGIQVARNFLFDKHVAVREIALRRLQLANAQLESIFNDVFNMPHPLPLHLRCAIWGLSELRPFHAAQTVTNWVGHGCPSVRKEAIHALVKLCGDQVQEILIKALDDESPGVAKESVRLLSKPSYTITLSDLQIVIGKGRWIHTRLVCMRLASKLTKWDRLIFILELAQSSNNVVRLDEQTLNSELEDWDRKFNESFSQPTVDQLSRIKIAYVATNHMLDRNLRNCIEFTLKCYGVNDLSLSGKP